MAAIVSSARRGSTGRSTSAASGGSRLEWPRRLHYHEATTRGYRSPRVGCLAQACTNTHIRATTCTMMLTAEPAAARSSTASGATARWSPPSSSRRWRSGGHGPPRPARARRTRACCSGSMGVRSHPCRTPPGFAERRDIDPAGKAAIRRRGGAAGPPRRRRAGRWRDHHARVRPPPPRRSARHRDHHRPPTSPSRSPTTRASRSSRWEGGSHPESRTAGRARRRRDRAARSAPTCACSVSAACTPRPGSPLLHRDEALVERAMIAGSRRVATLTGAEKLGSAGPLLRRARRGRSRPS